MSFSLVPVAYNHCFSCENSNNLHYSASFGRNSFVSLWSMKKHLFTILAAALMTAGGMHAQTVAPDSTGMTMSAHDFTKSVIMGWNLGNALESAGADWDNDNQKWINTWDDDYNEWETGWDNPKTTKAMLQAVKDAGFNAIRIPVRWVPHISNYSTMAINPTWLARVKQVVDWCMELDLTVILNTHHEKWLELNPYYSYQKTNLDKLEKLWTNIATAFRDYDQRLVFAGTNETTSNWQAPTKEEQEVQNSYNHTFVKAVRATGGKNYYRNLIIQTYACAPGYGLSGLTIPDDPAKNRLSIEFHYYDPYSYCSGDIENGCYYYWGSKYSSYGSTPAGEDERKIRNLFLQIRNTWFEKGYGVVIGEYGVSHHVDPKATATVMARQEENESYYLETLVSEARKNGFAAFVWDNNTFGSGTEKFGIFDRKNKMAISAQYLLDGIKAGSETGFQELSQTDTDPGAGGTVYWSGSKSLNWGEQGTQLNIPASKFTYGKDSVLVVFYYTQNPQATYDQIQVCNSGWSKLPFYVDGQQTDGDFSPRNFYGTVSGSHITAFTFKGASLKTAKSGGMNIQGYGVTLTKVSIVTTFTGVDEIAAPAHTPLIYRLDGTVTSHPEPGNIYIKEGKKILWK